MNENDLHSKVEAEIDNGIYDKELWETALNKHNGDELAAKDEYLKLRTEQIAKNTRTDEYQINNAPSREPVKKRNIVVGISILVLLVVLIIVLGFLLHGYFN